MQPIVVRIVAAKNRLCVDMSAHICDKQAGGRAGGRQGARAGGQEGGRADKWLDESMRICVSERARMHRLWQIAYA